MTTPLVSLIVVNLNGREHLDPFFASLAAQDFPPALLEVILIDNASTDDSVAHAERLWPGLRVVRNRENLGFAEANNQGAAIARGAYLALLNNDMRLAPDWFSRMVAYRRAAPPEVVCVGSRILTWDGIRVDFIGGGMTFAGMGFQAAYHAPVDSEAGTRYPERLLFACGGAMLVDRDVYLASGGLDADFFAYFEDVDFGWRLWVMGHEVGFCPEAVVYHRLHGTSSRFAQHKKLVLYERNALYTIIKNYDEANLQAMLPAAVLLAVKRMTARAGIDRDAFRFALGPPAAAAPVERQRAQASLVQRVRLTWRQLGWLGLLKIAVGKVARAALLWSSPQHAPGTIPIWPDAYAIAAALDDVADHLPALLEKRQQVQAARRRSDREIFPLFLAPIEASSANPGYAVAYQRLIEALGVDRRFASAAPADEVGRPIA